MDIDDIFEPGVGATQNWRHRVQGEALELCEKIEARIEETRERPNWRKFASALRGLGFQISDASLGDHYRERYPFLRKS